MGWTTALGNRIIIFVLGLFTVLYIVFQGRVYGFDWIIAAISITLSATYGIRVFSRRWLNINESTFIYKLFWNSLLLRVLIMLILLIISYKTWNMFYTVGAKDEQVYYRIAAQAADIWKQTNISDAYSYIYSSYKNDISDTGFSTFLMLIIFVLGQSPILIKIFLCFLGSIVVLRGYKLARILIEEPAARLAGILLLLYPISWFYSAIMLKEGIMVLLMIESLILIVKLQRSFNLKDFLLAMLFITILFFFRSAISILLFLVFGFSLLIQFKRRNLILNVIIAGIVILIYVYFLKSTGRYDEYYNQYTNVDEFTQERLSYIESINPLVALFGSPAFAALSYVSPFPSVVSVPNAGGLPHSEYYYHVAGNVFWIILAFFSFYGLYYAIRYKRQEMVAIISFVIGYQFVLLKAMMFTSVRFSYPAKPFLLILAAYGIYHMKSKKWYPVYLVAAVVMIVGWNYVRLKGRT